MDYLGHINTFITIVDEGTLHAAALKLHQTDAAISKKLSNLETSLNVVLLERGHGKMKLTEVGQQYYELCVEAVQKIANTKQLIQKVTILPKGELKVHAVKHNADLHIMPKLKGFLKKYPEIRLTLTTAEYVPNFARGEADIFFGLAMPILDQGENLVRKKIGMTRDILCATPAFLKKNGAPQKPKDLIALPYICHAARKPINLITFDNGIELPVQPFLKFDSHETLMNAALQDLGYVYVKEYMVEKQLKSGRLMEILPKHNKTQGPIYAYYRYQAHPDPKVRAFMEYFQS